MLWTWGLLRLRGAAASPLFPIVLRDIWRRFQTAVGGGQTDPTKSSEPTRPTERYPMPSKKDLPYDVVEQMEHAEKHHGFLPNVFKVMSHRPAEFRALFAYYDAIMNKESERLSKADKELIAVATSVANRCLYCVTAHAAQHRVFSKLPTLADQVIVNWELAELSPRELAMLSFALAVTRAENITDEHFKKLEAHGFDLEDAWDIAMVSAFFALANRMAHFIPIFGQTKNSIPWAGYPEKSKRQKNPKMTLQAIRCK
ncbi:uncharacterized protein LOC115092468 isoform X2 [Rhinatrema bivittatum]|uniref:uncharacterized protein LOC115092468 isoform X2 n=1 Tax=Rhinatrema bivittatum TaxID=194408 RepID=UPI00112D2588|nr:uncharacterized protein LOC115092468 isoform X2 [Rhinatrema bivittatum]